MNFKLVKILNRWTPVSWILHSMTWEHWMRTVRTMCASSCVTEHMWRHLWPKWESVELNEINKITKIIFDGIRCRESHGYRFTSDSSVCPTQLDVKPERDYQERQNKLCGDPWLIEYTFVRIPPQFCLCCGYNKIPNLKPL